MTQFVARNGIIALNNSTVSGSLDVTQNVVAQSVSSSFSGSGANLYDIPASGIVGLNLSQISSGSVSASISPDNGLQVNTNVTAPSFSGSFSGSGANLSGIPATGIVGLNLSQISSGSVSASISPNAGLQVNTNVTATSFSGSFSGSGANLSGIPASGIVGLNLSQIATGSVTASVSPSEFTISSGSSAEFVVRGTGVTVGNIVTDEHTVTGSLSISGSLNAPVITGSLFGTASFAVAASFVPYPEREYDSSGSYSYCGTAPSGSSTASPVWFITRLFISQSGQVTPTSASNAVWDDRYTAIYS